MKIDLEDIETKIDQLSQLVNDLKQIDKESIRLCFIGSEELAEYTGWSKKTAQAIFNKPDFPSTDFGKEKKAEIHAVINYFSVPRRK